LIPEAEVRLTPVEDRARGGSIRLPDGTLLVSSEGNPAEARFGSFGSTRARVGSIWQSAPFTEFVGSGSAHSMARRSGEGIKLVAQTRGQATKKKMKAFLPQWILWVVVPALLMMWALVTFSTFGTASPRSRYEIFRWLGATAIFALVGLVLWLMASGRLPAYVIEIEESDDRSSLLPQPRGLDRTRTGYCLDC
jgi:hypothetical protein